VLNAIIIIAFQVICDVVTAEIDCKFMVEVCGNVKGNFAAKMKIRDQVC
jgi:hypothetical protein